MGLYSIHKRYRDGRELTGLFEWKGFVDAQNLEAAARKCCCGEARTYEPEIGDMLFVKPTTQQRGDSGGQGLLFQVVKPKPQLSWEPR